MGVLLVLEYHPTKKSLQKGPKNKILRAFTREKKAREFKIRTFPVIQDVNSYKICTFLLCFKLIKVLKCGPFYPHNIKGSLNVDRLWTLVT